MKKKINLFRMVNIGFKLPVSDSPSSFVQYLSIVNKTHSETRPLRDNTDPATAKHNNILLMSAMLKDSYIHTLIWITTKTCSLCHC